VSALVTNPFSFIKQWNKLRGQIGTLVNLLLAANFHVMAALSEAQNPQFEIFSRLQIV
jgi:hypothetical protein